MAYHLNLYNTTEQILCQGIGLASLMARRFTSQPLTLPLGNIRKLDAMEKEMTVVAQIRLLNLTELIRCAEERSSSPLCATLYCHMSF